MAEKDHCEQCGVQPGSQVVGDQPCKLRGDTSTMLAQRVLSLDMSGGGHQPMVFVRVCEICPRRKAYPRWKSANEPWD